SVDNFLTTATAIATTSSTYTATNLTQTTYYRSIATGNSCSTSPSSVTKITVGSSVAGTISADNLSVCNGSAANLSLAGNVGNVLKWQSSADNVNWTDIANTTALYTTPGLSTGTYYYRAQVQSAGCSVIATTNAITITATSGSGSLGGTLSGANLCPSPNTATITLTGYTGVIQKWQYSTNSGATWTDIANTAATYTATNLAVTNSYRVSVKNGSCNAVNSSTGTITVNQLPVVAAITGTASVCTGATTTLSDATAGGVWTSGSTGVATVDASGVVTAVSAGTSLITYTVTNGGGCSTAVTKTVTVNALPTVAAITGTASVCAGSTTTLSDATTGGVWTSGTTSVATVNASGGVTGISAGTSVITYTFTNGSGCSKAVTQTLTVNALPTVAAITGTASVCAGSTTTLSDATTGGLWTSGSTAVATVNATGVVTGVSAGTSVITYTVTNGSGCSTTVTQSVTVNALPTVAAITGTAGVCTGATTTLSDATTGGVWSSGTSSVATVDGSGVVSAISTGTSVITYTVTNGSGCSKNVTQTLTVNALPTVAAITGTASVCVGSTTNLSDATSGGVWSSSNTSVATVNASGVVTGVAGGAADILYTVTNGSGCSGVATQTVTVNALPSIPAVTGTPNVCAGQTTTLGNTIAGGFWFSSNTLAATVDANGVISGIAAGTSVISYTLTNGSGCSNVSTLTVTVSNMPVTASITGTASVCAGLTTLLSNTTPNGVWSSSDNSIATVDASGLVTGMAAGSADITYTVTNGGGCSTSATQTVTVNALPIVEAITGNASVCTGLTTSLSEATSGGVWFSSNTLAATVDANGVVTGVAAGTADITYTVNNGSGCSEAATRTITVNDVPVVAAITGTPTICSGSTTTFSNTTDGGVWSSGTASVATIDANGVVTGVSAGTSLITYTVNNGSGCSTAVTQTVTVNALPVVSPIASQGSLVSLGYALPLSDATTGGLWSSDDDGLVSVDANGVATGVALGTANIAYTVTSGSGCSAKASIALTTVAYVHVDAPEVKDSLYYIGDPQNPSTPIDQISALPGASLTFYTSASGGSGSSMTPSLPTQPGTVTYWVTQTVNGSESDRISFKVTMVTPDVFVPKVFTPNNDGINDVIKPIIPGLKNFRYFKIYNRWGNLVYQSTDPNAGWDGTFHGTQQPRESYLWMIEGENMKGEVKKYSGMITLFR
ncbi:MAG: Ig-like domain-containing protein, partial [Puia sp.]